MLLEKLSIIPAETDLVRLASLPSSEFFQEQKLDEKSIREVVQFLHSQGVPIQPKDLVEQTFKPKHRLAKTKYATRFSDGSFPVLYGAIGARTAEEEAKHWFSKQVSGNPKNTRKVWYMRFKYRFSGKVKNLWTKKIEWSDLTHDNDYRFCNKLGAEAKEAGLDGLLAPSARKEGGTNLPAFARRAVNDFREDEFVTITCNPQTGETFLRES